MKKIKKHSEAVVAYKGTVNTALVKSGYIISKKQYHNQGLPNFFNALHNLLINPTDPDIINKIVPTSIALYSFKADAHAQEFGPNTDWKVLLEQGVLERITPYLRVSGRDMNDNEACLQFEISSDTLTAGKGIYLLALFPKAINDLNNAEDSAIAVYRLTGDDGSWEPTRIVASSILYIEWRMSFNNA
jgi:hypothetical protein